MADVTYTTAAGIWRRSGFVVIVSVLGTRIAVFPMDFLATCGNNTWDYVLFAVTCVIDVESQHPGKISDIQDRPVDLQAAPIEGTFCYVETGKNYDVKLSRGPEYFSREIAPSGIEESTRSASSQATRSRPDQNAFREALIARDSACLVTGLMATTSCDAAHIVPQSRPDVYEQLQGHSNDMFHSSSGMLLSKTLHHAYDALKWSFYQKGDTYYVHFFNPEDITFRQVNGKAIPPSRFRYHEGPDPVLIAWHYRQTVRARIRGFSVDMKRR